jgi:hypothetical protein
MNKIILMLIFLIITLKVNAQITFEAYVNKNPIKENDLLELTVVCVGANLDSEPEISILKDFDIVSQSSSNQMQIVNGNIVSSESYIYNLLAKKTGKLIIPPITGYINNVKYQTKEIIVEVLPDKNLEKVDDSKIAYIKAEINKKEVFLNEQLIYTLKFYRRVNTEKNNLTFPDFKDFTVEDFGKQKDYQTKINDKIYAVTEIKKVLIPNKTGIIKISQANLLVEIPYKEDNYFFGNYIKKETKNLKSEELKLIVKSLPNNLSEIVSNKIDYELNISSKKIKLGDSIDLKIKFVGDGNIYDLELDNLAVAKSKIYKDKSNSKNFIKDDKLFSEKKFNFGIVPLSSGKLIINIPKITYFNPNKKKYEFININPLEIEVEENNINNQSNLNNFSFEKKIKENKKLEDKSINHNKLKKNLVIIIIIFVLLFVTTLLILFLKVKNRNNEVKKDNKNNITNEKSIFKNIDYENFDEVYKVFINLIKTKNIPSDKVKDFNKLEEEFYKIKFSNSYNQNEKKQILKKASTLIKEILNR